MSFVNKENENNQNNQNLSDNFFTEIKYNDDNIDSQDLINHVIDIVESKNIVSDLDPIDELLNDQLLDNLIISEDNQIIDNENEVDMNIVDEICSGNHDDDEETCTEVNRAAVERLVANPMTLKEHFAGKCKPCMFRFRKKICKFGSMCRFCHFCSSDQIKDDKRKKKKLRQILLQNTYMIDNLSDHIQKLMSLLADEFTSKQQNTVIKMVNWLRTNRSFMYDVQKKQQLLKERAQDLKPPQVTTPRNLSTGSIENGYDYNASHLLDLGITPMKNTFDNIFQNPSNSTIDLYIEDIGKIGEVRNISNWHENISYNTCNNPMDEIKPAYLKYDVFQDCQQMLSEESTNDELMKAILHLQYQNSVALERMNHITYLV